jgi:hypothetical protein
LLVTVANTLFTLVTSKNWQKRHHTMRFTGRNAQPVVRRRTGAEDEDRQPAAAAPGAAAVRVRAPPARLGYLGQGRLD